MEERNLDLLLLGGLLFRGLLRLLLGSHSEKIMSSGNLLCFDLKHQVKIRCSTQNVVHNKRTPLTSLSRSYLSRSIFFFRKVWITSSISSRKKFFHFTLFVTRDQSRESQ